MSVSPNRWRRGKGLAACAVVLGFAVAACEQIQEQLGTGKQSPDEFAVVTRAPLRMPPNYSLRLPSPGAPRPQEPSMRETAKAVLYGTAPGARASVGRTQGEQALLNRAGTANAPSNIRRVLNEERVRYDEERDTVAETLVDALIFWRQKPAPGDIVDPAKEARRLDEARARGEAPTGDDTPVIKRRKKGLLEGLF